MKDNFLKVQKFNSEEIINKNDEITNVCLDIINSHEEDFETFNSTDSLLNLNSKIFLENSKAFIYVLNRADEPVSFAVFYGKNLELKMLFTKNGYENCGFDEFLLKNAFADLSENENARAIYFQYNAKNKDFNSSVINVVKDLGLPKPQKNDRFVRVSLEENREELVGSL